MDFFQVKKKDTDKLDFLLKYNKLTVVVGETAFVVYETENDDNDIE